MISNEEAVVLADEFLRADTSSEVPLIVARNEVIVRDSALIAPCNSAEFIRTDAFEDMVIGCTPVRVDLTTGACRFLTHKEAMEFGL